MVQFEPPLGAKNVVCTAEGCGKLYTFSGGSSGTSNMWTHVKIVHSQLAAELSAGSSRSGDAKESAVKTYEGAADQLRQGSETTGGERKRRSLVSYLSIGPLRCKCRIIALLQAANLVLSACSGTRPLPPWRSTLLTGPSHCGVLPVPDLSPCAMIRGFGSRCPQ